MTYDENEKLVTNLQSMIVDEVPEFGIKEDWELDLVIASSVKPETVKWRWTGKLAFGKVSMLIGDPEARKSFVSLAMATAVTLGTPMPGDTERHPPQNVLLLSAEDGIADTIVPRLIAMGADMDRVTILKGLKKTQVGDIRTLNLSTDLKKIDAELSKGGYGMVVIDPINAYTPSVDGKSDVSVRTLLAPMGELADRHQVMFLLVRHLNKNEGRNVLYRSMDSIGYVAMARSVLLVGRNPEDEDESVIIGIKNSNGKRSKGISFRIEGDGVFKWGGESDLTADQLVTSKSDEEKSAMGEAEDFILAMLEDGCKLATECVNEYKQNGFASRTIDRAKKNLGIKSEKEKGVKNGPFYWRCRTEDCQHCQENVGDLGDVPHVHSEQGEIPIKPGLNSWNH